MAMVNPFAGETALTINGQTRVLKLTLGALAELESTLKTDTLLALIERFENGCYSVRDILAVIVAGLRGGGWDIAPDDLMHADIQGGMPAAAAAAARALVLAFAIPEEQQQKHG